jgi:UDP-N-acetylmuramate dehydrogenase
LHVSDLRHALPGYQGTIRESVSLAPLAHLRIGGPAEFFLEPKTETDVCLIAGAAKEFGQPLNILGGGSNVVIADSGVPGMTVSLSHLNRVMRDEGRVTAGAGVTLPSLIRGTKDLGLAGLELLIGIPACVGGAVAMNAGTRETATFERLVSVTVVDVDAGGELCVLGREQTRPEYRDGGLGNKIVVQATFELAADDPQAIYGRMKTSLKRRNATQPVTEKCVGCVFVNPEGDAAGRMIEAAGCKTMRRGNIVVSGKHANYFVNEGGGTSRDFLALVEDVRDRVAEKFGVVLVPEVKIWGG